LLRKVEQIFADLRSVWRFRYGGLLLGWLVCVLGWCVVFVLPQKYETRTRVYVDTNSLLRPLLQGLAVPPNTINQVDMVRGVLLARPQLETVIDSTNLKLRVRKSSDRDAMLGYLAKTIQIQSEGRGGENSERVPTFYTITYRDSDPAVSLAVVNSLLTSFVSESLGANRSSTETAQKFLTEQLKDYDQKLSDSERDLAEFKRKNLGAMPDERGGYFARLQAEMTELDRLRSQLSVSLVRREDLRSKLVGGASTAANSAGDPAALETSVDAPLATAKAKLADLLLRFTDQHPDVIAMRSTIAQLETQRKDEVDSMRANRGALGSPRGSTSLVAQNLQIALNQIEVEVAGLQSQIADRQQRVQELRQSINTVPEVEAELSRLTRNYNVTKIQYDALLQRSESAKLSGQADKTDDRKIRVVDPPILAREAVSPKTFLLQIGVLAGGIAAGIAYAILKSRMAPVFSNIGQMALAFKLPILGSIDRIAKPSTLRWARVQSMIFCALVLSLLAAFGAVVIYSKYGQQVGAVARGVLLRS
jgi:polysaccharide chain length determinant protein (PEP-CTERM system associated)